MREEGGGEGGGGGGDWNEGRGWMVEKGRVFLCTTYNRREELESDRKQGRYGGPILVYAQRSVPLYT